MTEPERPGLAELVSLLAEDRLGRPGPAREAALAAAQADPANAHVHLLDASYAALVAGEPRAAERLLADCEAAMPGSETWQRRIAACRAWLWTLDRNRYPGEVAAEVVHGDPPAFPVDRPSDPETRLVEAIASDLNALLSLRAQVEQQVRTNPTNAHALVAQAIPYLQQLQAAAQDVGAVSTWLTAHLALGDLLRRAGRDDEANDVLAEVRRQYETLAANGVASPVGLASTYLTEGDWYATPGSSPEAVGFDLATLSAASPFLAHRDPARAAAAYDRAAGLLDGVDEPRPQAALALRRAGLAWLVGDYVAQRSLVDAAAAAFAKAGDAAGERLAAVHGLLADVALGSVASVRHAVGSSFDLRPRGPLEEILSWSSRDGSVAWTTGLGRLLQRAGAHWDRAGDYDRAEVAYEMAAPLVPASGAEASATVLVELANVDRRNGFVLRALTRSRLAVATLPTIDDVATQGLDWGRWLNAVLDVALGEIDTAATAAGTSVVALEWAIDRAEALLALPGVPAAGSGRGFDLEAIQREAAARTLDDLAAEVESGGSVLQRKLLAATADGARDMIALADAFASLQRGRQAAAIGASATAERWYEDARRKADALPDEFAALPAIIAAARDRFDEARACLRSVPAASGTSNELLASAAVRAGDYETATRLFGSRDDDRDRPWPDLLDRAEAALGARDVARAVSLTDAAVDDFETRFGRLRRDVDRMSATDDVKVAALYLLAARAWLAQAEQLQGDDESKARARSFELGDRARALVIGELLADASDDSDDERLILGWRRASSERQAAYERLYRAYVTAATDEAVAARIADLTVAESSLTEVEAQLEEARPGRRAPTPRREPPGLADVQRALPQDAVLVEYQLVDRDLLVWAITRATTTAAASRHATGAIARLAKAVQRDCANGQPGPEAAELAAALIDPLASVIAGSRRLIVVPYGPLHGLPFHVLPLRGRPLGESLVVSYLPAAALLHGAIVDEPLGRRPALVVGDPAFDPEAHPSLRRLAGAAVEARSVAGTHAAVPLVGDDATEQRIYERMDASAVVHLAAHGRLDRIAPSDSSIVLAGHDQLTVSDLVGLRIDAELAVLSACDSGRGAASLGGDVVGLTRGLIAAGARRSVVSLWPVDDAPACVTMSIFHEQLVAEVPVATALHGAQAAVRGMAGAVIAARYAELGGEPGDLLTTRRRGVPAAPQPPLLPLDPEFVDDLADDEPLDTLSGDLARIWAPFVLIGA